MDTNQPRARRIIDLAVGSQPAALPEATVRRPPRSRNYVALYTGVEPGTQVARSTGLSDETAARELATEWEEGARREREKRKLQTKGQRQSYRGTGGLTQAETAALLRISERSVRNAEKRALTKLMRNPAIRAIWKEYTESRAGTTLRTRSEHTLLSPQETSALLGLARTAFEVRVLRKALAIVRQAAPSQ